MLTAAAVSAPGGTASDRNRGGDFEEDPRIPSTGLDISPPSSATVISQPSNSVATSTEAAGAEPAPARMVLGKRTSAEKRNRRCAVIENTIIAANEDELASDSPIRGTDETSMADPEMIDDRPVPELHGDAKAVSLLRVNADFDGDGQDAADVLGAVTDALLAEQFSPSASSPPSLSSQQTVEDQILLWLPASDDGSSEPVTSLSSQQTVEEQILLWLPASADGSSEPVTSLNVDLVIANETNEASLPMLRKPNRRKSLLRRTTTLDDDDEVGGIPSSDASPTSRSPTSPSTPTDAAPERISPFIVISEDATIESEDATIESEDATIESGVLIGEEEASGAAVALKRRLSLRLSAMSEYNPDTDYNNKTLQRGSLSKPGMLKRVSRARLRPQSLRTRSKSNWGFPSDSSTSPGTRDGMETSCSPQRLSLASPSEAGGNEIQDSGNGEMATHGHRRARSYPELEAQSPSRSPFDPFYNQAGGELTETVVSPDGNVVVLGSSDKSVRRASDSDSMLSSGRGTNNPSSLPFISEEIVQPSPLPPSELDEVPIAARDGDKSDLLTTSPKSSTPATQQSEKFLSLSNAENLSGAVASANRHDAEHLKGKIPGKGRQQQQQQQYQEEQAPPPLHAPTKPKWSSPWSWLFGDGESGTHRKSVPPSSSSGTSSPGLPSTPPSGTSTPVKESGAALPSAIQTTGSSVVNKDLDVSLPPTGGELPGVTTSASVASGKEKPHKKASAALSALFTSRGSKSSPSKSSPAKTAAQAAEPKSPPAKVQQNSDKLATAATYANRYPVHIERAIYRLSHAKLANPKRPLIHQVLISNMMFWYIALVAQRQQLLQQQLASRSGSHSDDDDDYNSDESDPEDRPRWRKAKKKVDKELSKKAEKESKKKKKDTRN